MKLLIDSGAFAAWRLGEYIDLDKYIDYCNENSELIYKVVNLDVIPGSFGNPPTPQEVEQSASQSWHNLEHMESQGISPIPVFHQGENFGWLQRMVDEGYDYVGISPDNGKSVGQKRDWLDRVFTCITDEQGRPLIKTHGFAVTSIDLLYRYPFYSVDSATWIVLGAFGSTMVPKWDGDDFTYVKSPYVVNISNKSNTSLERGMHFLKYGDATREHISQFFNSLGYTLDDVANTFEARSFVCLRVLARVQEALRGVKFTKQVNDFFLDGYMIEREPIEDSDLNIYYALSCAAVYSDMLTIEKLDRRLFTYQILKDKPAEFLEFYENYGVFPDGKCYRRMLSAGDPGNEKVWLEELEYDAYADVGNRKRGRHSKTRDWSVNKHLAEVQNEQIGRG